MSGAIASSSSAFLLLPFPSSSPRRRRNWVSRTLRSYGDAGTRLHLARRVFSRDGEVPCRRACATAGGEEGAAKEAAGKTSKGISGWLRGKVKASENEEAASSKAIAEQNWEAGSKSKVDPSSPVPRVELGSNVQVAESAAASGYWKDVALGEQVGAKVDTSGDAEMASSSDDSENKGSGPLAGPNVMNVIVVASECAPFCKTGGLGDVVGALPKTLARRGHRVMVVIPKYGDYAKARDLGVRKRYKVAGQDSEVTYFHSYIDGVDFVYLEAPPFRHRHNDIYGGCSEAHDFVLQGCC